MIDSPLVALEDVPRHLARRRDPYESQSEHPPTKLLPLLVEVLGVSADELLGIRSSKQRRPDGRLRRRFKQLEQLPVQQRRQILQIVDALLERERLRKKSSSRATG